MRKQNSSQMSKKSEVITFRTDPETKNKIEEIALQKEWSVAQVVDKICKEFFNAKEKYEWTSNTNLK